MARVYQITEAEMQGLLDGLAMVEMGRKGMLKAVDFQGVSPEERKRLDMVHNAFRQTCIQWAQDMGFEPKGGR